MPPVTVIDPHIPGLLGEASSYPYPFDSGEGSGPYVRRQGDDAVKVALARLRSGGTVVLTGAQEPVRAAVLSAAQGAGATRLNAMTTRARGPVHLALPSSRCDELGVTGSDRNGRASVGARHGLRDGISAADQARTVEAAASVEACAADLCQPGPVLLTRARELGVREHLGLAEGAVDLVRLAGMRPAAVYCPIVDATGALAGPFELETFCHATEAPMVTVEELLAYRLRHEPRLSPGVACALPTTYGTFEAVGYRSAIDESEHLALIRGTVPGAHGVPVSVHTRCALGDLFGSRTCDCRARLDSALESLAAQPVGTVIYLGYSHCPAAEHGGEVARIIDRPDFSAIEASAVVREILRDLRVESARFLALPAELAAEELVPGGTPQPQPQPA